MKLPISKLIMASAVLLSACQTQKESSEGIIGKSHPKVENGIMTPEVMYTLGRVGGIEISPDKKKILYGVTYVSIPENKSNRELFVMDIDGSNKIQITHTPKSEQNAVWINNGKQIAFLTSESGSSQLWIMDADGSNRKQISNQEKGIDGFLLSPDEKKVEFF